MDGSSYYYGNEGTKGLFLVDTMLTLKKFYSIFPLRIWMGAAIVLLAPAPIHILNGKIEYGWELVRVGR